MNSLQTKLQELEGRYKHLEVTCNDIFYSSEDDSIYNDLSNVLDEKQCMLEKIQTQIASLTGPAPDSTKDNTAELVKSFKASLTLPKPQFHKFDGNPSSFSSFLAHIETYVESTIDDYRQLLSILIIESIIWRHLCFDSYIPPLILCICFNNRSIS